MTVSEYNRCVDQYADNVYRFILKHIGDREKAHDIVQDTFEKMWIKRQFVDPGKARSYLFTSAYHTMIDSIRKEKKTMTFEMSELTAMRHQDNQYSDLQEILHQAIDRLPLKQKSVVLLRDYEGYSYKEIAGITGLNESQVKVYIYRARMYLKNYIGSLEAVL